MTPITHFDTLVYANKLKEGGVPARQAETEAETLAEIFKESLATKQDITELKNITQNDIAELRSTTKQDIAALKSDMDSKFAAVDLKFAAVDIKFSMIDVRFSELKAEMIKWVVGISLAQTALIVSLLKILH
jgi:hypothetical protein